MSVYPDARCRAQIESLRLRLSQCQRQKTRLGWLRLCSLAIPALLIWFLHNQGWTLVLPLLITGFTVFLYLVSRDTRNQSQINRLEKRILINETELRILAHDFHQLSDGSEFNPGKHVYAADLDLFGKASLFQLINRATAEQGQALLAQWLLEPAGKETISIRQTAIKELAGLHDFRENLQASGMEKPLTRKLQNSISAWVNSDQQILKSSMWNLLRYAVPVISLSLLIAFSTGFIPNRIFWPLLLLMTCISFWFSKITLPLSKGLTRISHQLESLEEAAGLIESTPFKSERLILLQQELIKGDISCSRAIRSFKKIMDRTDYRLNPLVYLPLNIFLCWDLQQAIQLKAWKKQQAEGITHWFHALAEMETLSSFATLTSMRPQWHFPIISEEAGVFDAVRIGHPLIHPEQSVRNDFSTHGRGFLNLITGSNMAGKSTFLRTCGINLVLALAGAPVDAESCTVSVMQLMSSMRISDNLEENTSTFYAELKKLREIIEAAGRHEHIFLLLDEILRGTNSADRQAGSMALIKQLFRDQACGLVATHDLALTDLTITYPDQLMNFHFDVQVNGEELYFDYKLKNGICTSMNASLLMKKIGIDL